ncbi:MAG TPA: bifunctional hydroxymethylpyrimidine kinase/phosphomethylpyrimidine kinase, partial [Acidimicrobiaceae bacterium]|nr:bifunctional hydroxymethylpyrimidine kinase/phosphomethylpyrimidine kinase [Acidimicrobiaceae bacterium]
MAAALRGAGGGARPRPRGRRVASPTVPTPLVALTVAGVDSAGGAGVHADLRAFAAHGLHGATAVAALTAQSTRAVEAVHVVP